MAFLSGALSGIFGSKPSVPPWQNITLGGQSGQQGLAIGNNLQVLPQAEQLAKGVTSFNQSQLTDMLNQIMPGWSGNVATASKNISDELSGKLPTDVIQQIQSSDAAQALTGGFGGTGLAGNLTARDLGITSLNLMQQGQSSLESWSQAIDRMFAPEQFDVSSMFVSPQQEFTATMQNQEMNWSQSWLSNQVSAMPDPTLSGLWTSFNNLVDSFASGAGGMMMA